MNGGCLRKVDDVTGWCKEIRMRRLRCPTVVYPVLGTDVLDLWFLRLSGHGLGNCFYTYFHAVALAEKYDAVVVAPAWFSLKIGPLLRRERSKRLYWRMFKPFSGELHGPRKLLTMLRAYRNRVVLKVGERESPVVVKNALNFVVSSKFTFVGLHEHRRTIRDRILGTLNDPVPDNHRWGDGGYIAVHIRLGDFMDVAGDTLIGSTHPSPNLRIPLSWYLNVINGLRKCYVDRPIYVFSDGAEKMLAPILHQGAQVYRSGSDMTDLLAMSGASILVGSNSTYSRWAAFLGNMPSIWLKTAAAVEKPTGPETPIAYLPLDYDGLRSVSDFFPR